jgi:type IV pilus assembly protein PilQ
MTKENHDRHGTFCLVALLLMVFLVSGCAAQPEETKDQFFEQWREKADHTKGHSPSAKKQVADLPQKKTATMTAVEPEIEQQRLLPTQNTTLEMHDIEVAVLLRAMAKAVNQNIVISENVKGAININVKEAQWDQIFLSVLNTHGLTYGWKGDILHIISIEDKEKMLKQLETDQKIKTKKREIELVEPLLTRIVKVEYSDAIKLKENLEKFLTEKAEGKPLGGVMVDEHTNSLIIQAIREDIQSISNIIAALDRPTIQVLIEAQIVEANRSTARELGIQWGGLYHDSGQDLWIGPNTDGAVGVTDGGIVDQTSGYAANFPADLTDNTGLTLGFIAEGIGNTLLSVELQALEQDGKVNILSSPSISTLDHQAALIESGNEVPYQTVEDGEVNIEYKKAVLSLEVTPHVIDEKTVKLEIKTNKDELDWTNDVSGNPTVITKKAETTVIVYDGQTTVIGGLSKEKSDISNEGIPFLREIPLLGFLFGSEGKSNEMEEVLIFITPHVLKERKANPQPLPDEPLEDPLADPSAMFQPTPTRPFLISVATEGRIR